MMTYEGGRIMDGPALGSADGMYRYTLRRMVSMTGTGRVMFLMLNPSTADAINNDPTVRRCMRFASDWGFAELVVGNLFAYRTVLVTELRAAADPVGPHNDQAIIELAALSDLVVCAWGNSGALYHRDLAVLDFLAEASADHLVAPTAALGINQASGHPTHPLYVRADCKPMPFGRRDADRAARETIPAAGR